MEKRYFIVFFKYNNGDGMLDFRTNGCYLNLQYTMEAILKKFDLKAITFTNIIELSTTDYQDWIRKENEDEQTY